jgi:outer membrane protein
MTMFSSSTTRRLVMAAALAVMSLSVSAQSLRIGYVNLERILRDSTSAKAAQTKLEKEFATREKEIQNLAAQLKSASEKFEREAPTLAEAQRTTRQRQLIDQDREFQRKQREFQEDLNLRKNEELQGVLERANRVIRQIAETDKYDLIIQEAVYINPKHDITDKVIGGLNGAK